MRKDSSGELEVASFQRRSWKVKMVADPCGPSRRGRYLVPLFESSHWVEAASPQSGGKSLSFGLWLAAGLRKVHPGLFCRGSGPLSPLL